MIDRFFKFKSSIKCTIIFSNPENNLPTIIEYISEGKILNFVNFLIIYSNLQ